MKEKIKFEELAPFFAALGNKTRFSIIELLIVNPRTVTEIYSTLQQKQSKISNELKCLKGCGFVHVEKHGNKRFYFMDKEMEIILLSIKIHLKQFNKKIKKCKTCCQ